MIVELAVPLSILPKTSLLSGPPNTQVDVEGTSGHLASRTVKPLFWGIGRVSVGLSVGSATFEKISSSSYLKGCRDEDALQLPSHPKGQSKK